MSQVNGDQRSIRLADFKSEETFEQTRFLLYWHSPNFNNRLTFVLPFLPIPTWFLCTLVEWLYQSLLFYPISFHLIFLHLISLRLIFSLPGPSSLKSSGRLGNPASNALADCILQWVQGLYDLPSRLHVQRITRCGSCLSFLLLVSACRSSGSVHRLNCADLPTAATDGTAV